MARPSWLDAVAAQLTGDGSSLRAFPPPPHPPRTSAVLMLFGPTDDARAGGVRAGADGLRHTDVLLTKRAAHLRAHPGQVSFPGGRQDAGDPDAVAAALREAHEEAGVRPDTVEVVADLHELYLSPSGNAVTPVLAWWPDPHPVDVVDPGEVAQVARVRLADLIDPDNRFTVALPSGFRSPAVEVDGLFIWGFTALLLYGVLDAAGLTVPYDTSRMRPIPADVGPSIAVGPLPEATR